MPQLINLKTGEFKLDEYSLIIHPNLTLTAFKGGGIPLEDLLSNEKGEISFRFNGKLETLNAVFHIYFTRGVLYRLSVFFGKEYNLEQGDPINDWLTKITGQPPPFEYEWGCLVTEDDRSDSSFSMVTRYCIADYNKRNYVKVSANIRCFHSPSRGFQLAAVPKANRNNLRESMLDQTDCF